MYISCLLLCDSISRPFDLILGSRIVTPAVGRSMTVTSARTDHVCSPLTSSLNSVWMLRLNGRSLGTIKHWMSGRSATINLLFINLNQTRKAIEIKSDNFHSARRPVSPRIGGMAEAIVRVFIVHGSNWTGMHRNGIAVLSWNKITKITIKLLPPNVIF